MERQRIGLPYLAADDSGAERTAFPLATFGYDIISLSTDFHSVFMGSKQALTVLLVAAGHIEIHSNF
jgi:hypothetical protein